MTKKFWVKKYLNRLRILSFLIFVIIVFPYISFSQYGQSQIELYDKQSFMSDSPAWIIAGGVYANPINEKDGFQIIEDGDGLLVGSATGTEGKTTLITREEYGDVILEFDVMTSHEAHAELFLQGRYGMVIADSWGKKRMSGIDNGSIIEPEEWIQPSRVNIARQNVSRAPGTWQHYKIEFEAPVINESNDKIKSARFVRVTHNGVVIHENKFLDRPSRGAPFEHEAIDGPIVFRINEGEVALRNIQYTKLTDKRVQLSDVRFELYEDQYFDDMFMNWRIDGNQAIDLPDLESSTLVMEGETESVSARLGDQSGTDFALLFKGSIEIPLDGKYTFDITERGLGSFKIDGKQLFIWDSHHDRGTNSNTIELSAGTYTFSLTYFNIGSPAFGIFAEGPGIRRQGLHDSRSLPYRGSNARPIILKPTDNPIVQRSFIYHGEEKLVSCISVGEPNGINYTLNLESGGLTQVWKGRFGDVSTMWVGRGEQQVLEPLGSVILLDSGQQILVSQSGGQNEPENLIAAEYRLTGYDMHDDSRPIFQYRVEGVEVRDYIQPGWDNRGLTRTLQFESNGHDSPTFWYKIAAANQIDETSDGLFTVDDQSYFIKLVSDVEQKPIITRGGDGKKWLVVPFTVDADESTTFKYSMIW